VGKTTLFNRDEREDFKMLIRDKYQGKDQGMTRVKVITEKHTTKECIFRQNLQGVEEGEQLMVK
jgi:hypothetical protein